VLYVIDNTPTADMAVAKYLGAKLSVRAFAKDACVPRFMRPSSRVALVRCVTCLN